MADDELDGTWHAAEEAHLTVAGCFELLRTDALARGDFGTAVLATAIARALEVFDFGTPEHAAIHRAVVESISSGDVQQGTFTGWLGARWLADLDTRDAEAVSDLDDGRAAGDTGS